MRIKVHRSAKVDLLDGKLFYDNQQLGLGDYFESSLESDIESLKLYAGIHPKHRGFHKALSERFPYSIYYRIVDGAVRVYAVLDNRADPQANEDRLDAADELNP